MHILKTLTSSNHLAETAIEKVYLTSLPSKDLKNRLETDFTKDFTGGRLCAETVTVPISQIISWKIVATFFKIEYLIYQIQIFW